MFSPTIQQLTTTTTNHANNFNAINNVLIANDNFLKSQADDSANKIDVLLNRGYINSTHKTVQSVNDLVDNGKYGAGTAISDRPGVSAAIVDVSTFDDNFKKQSLLHANGTFWLRVMEGGIWYEWNQVAYRSILDVEFVNGWGLYLNLGQASVRKTGNICSIAMEINGGVVAENGIIFNLPIGYRPPKITPFICGCRDTLTAGTTSDNALIVIATDGNVRFSGQNTLPVANRSILLNLTWGVG